MQPRLLLVLVGLLTVGQAKAQDMNVSMSRVGLAGQALPVSTSDPELNWRDPQWLSRQRERSRWRYQLGLEQQLRSPVQLGPQAAVREAVWAGVSYDLTGHLSGGVEAPVWQRDSGWASRTMNFERPKGEGLASLRGALSYNLGPNSKMTLRPQAHRVMLNYSARW